VDFRALQQAPEDDHQSAVGNRQVGREHGAPVALVFAQSFKTRAGRRDQKSPMVKHRGNGSINIAVEEADTENLLAGSHKQTSNIQYRTPNIESKGVLTQSLRAL
jgi:hypothetical protein